MNPPSKYTRIHPSPDSLKAIRKFSPGKTIRKHTQETSQQVMEGVKSALSLLDNPFKQRGTRQYRISSPVAQALRENPLDAGEINPIFFLEPALNVESARKQKLALKEILKDI